MSFNERHKNVDTRPAGKARDLSRHGDIFKYLPEWREGIQQLTPQNESVRSPFLKLDEISGMSPIQGHELQRFLFYSSASCGWAFLSSGFLLSSQRSQVLIGDEPLTLQFPPFSLSHPPTPFPLHFRQVIWPSVSLVLLWKFSLSLYPVVRLLFYILRAFPSAAPWKGRKKREKSREAGSRLNGKAPVIVRNPTSVSARSAECRPIFLNIYSQSSSKKRRG